MWGESLAELERADRLQRHFCQLGEARSGCPNWEPPVDMFETEGQVAVMIALPGVAAEHLSIELDGAAIVVRARRALAPNWRHGRIHRLELPYGKFERRIELPLRPLSLGERSHRDGCLLLVFDKAGSRA
jgi:HSP20 family molecular chaperone IbpA